jgi:mono/diheme cytochrome c family protein
MVRMKYILGLPLLFLYSFYSASERDYLPVGNVIQKKSDLEKSIENGKEIYTDFCIQCHMATGKGDLKNFPPLDGSDWLNKKVNQSIHAVKFGQTGEIIVNGKKFNNTMPPMGLSNQEVADVMNYVRNSWTNKHRKMITPKQVEAIKQ